MMSYAQGYGGGDIIFFQFTFLEIFVLSAIIVTLAVVRKGSMYTRLLVFVLSLSSFVASAAPASSKDADKMVAAFLMKSVRDGSAALPPEGFTPVKLIHNPILGKGLKSLSVQFCLVRFDYLKYTERNIAPFHSNLIAASGCDDEGRRVSMRLVDELIPAIAYPMGSIKSAHWSGLPRGVVLHIARCGSTAIANTLGATPDAISLSEPEFVNEAFDLRQFNVISREELVLLLRVLAQLTSGGAREIALLAGGNLFSENSRLVLKLSSNTPLFLTKEEPLALLREAWPDAKWAFVVRDPAAVVTAQLSPSFSEYMDEGISPRVAAARAPCMKSRVIQSPYVENTLRNLTGLSSTDFPSQLGHLALTMEAYCALHTASIYRSVLAFDDALREPPQRHKEVQTKGDDRGVRGVLILEHGELPEGVLDRLLPHFGFDLEEFSDDQLDIVRKVGKTYSKNGANTTDYVGKDSVTKRNMTSSAVLYWTERLTLPFHREAQRRRCDSLGTCPPAIPPAPELPTVPTASTPLDFSIGDLLFSGGILDGGHTLQEGGAEYDHMVSYSDGRSALSEGFPQSVDRPECPQNIVLGTGPYAELEPYSAFSRMTLVAMEQFQAGSWMEADACWRHALTQVETDACHNGTTACLRFNRQNIIENLAALEDSISRSSGARIWHGKAPAIKAFQPEDPSASAMHDMWAKMVEHYDEKGEHESLELSDGIEVYPNMLSKELCEYIIELFDRSDELYSGNVLRKGRAEVDDSVKSTKEIDIGNSRFPIWHAVEWTLVQALTTAFSRYEVRYSGYSFLPNPLFEDGFRVKKYETAAAKAVRPEYRNNDGELRPGSHNWHVDSSDAQNCRKVAAVYYLNDVEKGGETLFLTPKPRAVKPRQGSILLFPAGPSHYHAGAAVESGPKYAISNFLSVCDLDAALGVPIRPPLNRTALKLVRTYFQTPPHMWRRDSSKKKQKVRQIRKIEL